MCLDSGMGMIALSTGVDLGAAWHELPFEG